MRRTLDYVLAIAILAAVGYGAYRLGHLVDTTSTKAGEASSGVTTTTVGTAVHHSHRPSRRTIEIVIVAVAGAAAVMVLVSLAGSLIRVRRRQHWRSP